MITRKAFSLILALTLIFSAAVFAEAEEELDIEELIETIERYTDGLIFTMQMQEVIKSLSAAKAPKKDGKGNVYVDLISAHMPLMDAMQNASRKAFTRAFCY